MITVDRLSIRIIFTETKWWTENKYSFLVWINGTVYEFPFQANGYKNQVLRKPLRLPYRCKSTMLSACPQTRRSWRTMRITTKAYKMYVSRCCTLLCGFKSHPSRHLPVIHRLKSGIRICSAVPWESICNPRSQCSGQSSSCQGQAEPLRSWSALSWRQPDLSANFPACITYVIWWQAVASVTSEHHEPHIHCLCLMISNSFRRR